MQKSLLVIGNSISFAALFEARGWAVIMCSDLSIAMGRMFGDDPYNVVLINCPEPIADGLRLIKFTREIEHRRTTAIVMIAKNVTEADESRWAGADRALVSPVNSHSLIQVVEEQAK